MQLKIVTIEGKTYAEVQDGKPVYITDGRDVPFDAPQTVATITRLNGEAKAHREAKEAAEGKLKVFEGIEDGEAARKALETVKNLKDGELVSAGKVEEIKIAAKKAAEEQVAATNKAHAEEIQKLTASLDKLTSQYHGEKIGGAFSASKFVTDKLVLPGPAAQKLFGDLFKVEEGKLVAYDAAGNRLYSRARPGEVAEFDEALETLVENYPYRDHILKGTGSQGTGKQPNAQNGNGAKQISRTDFAKLSPTEQMATVKAGTQVVDAA